MTDEPSELDLHAYVDDQLDIGRRFAVETHLSGNPPLAARVMGELSTRTALRLLAHDGAAPSAAMLGKAESLGKPPRRPAWRKGFALGGASLAAAVFGFLLLPDAPPSYVDMALSSHRVAMMRAHMTSHAVPPALNTAEIMASTQINLPALPAHWHVTDVQIFPAGNGPALLVAIRTDQGEQLSIFAIRKRSNAPEIPDAIREGLQSVAYWRRGDMSYALTGEADPNAVDETAEFLNRSWS